MIKRLGRYNVYVERSKKYVGTISLFIQISLFIAINLQLELAWWQYLVVFILSPAVFLVFGYFDVKFGIMSSEQKFYGDKNPIYDDIFKRLTNIESKIENISDNSKL